MEVDELFQNPFESWALIRVCNDGFVFGGLTLTDLAGAAIAILQAGAIDI